MKKTIILTLFLIFGLSILNSAVKAQVTLSWEQRYNGSGNGSDGMFDMFTDNAGNTFICGYAFRSETATNDIVVAKYNSSGALQWRSFYDGGIGGIDVALALAVDNSGNVFITGRSQETGTGFDIITIKYNSAGTSQWVRLIDGAGNSDDQGNDITIDAAGNPCIVGTAFSGPVDGSNIVVAKYNSNNGTNFFPIYEYNQGTDIGTVITTDASNNIYVSGTWGNQVAPSVIHSQITTFSLSQAGSLRWIKYFGTPFSFEMRGQDIEVDNSGNIVVTGYMQNGSPQYKAGVVKYNSGNGGEIWNAVFSNPGSSEDSPWRLAIDDSNHIYFTGYTIGANGRDMLTVKLTSSGALGWIKTYNYSPTNNWDEARDIVVKGRWVYVTGWVTGPVQKDFVVFKYDKYDGSQQWGNSYFGPVAGDDGAFRIGVDNSNNIYLSGNSWGGSSNFDWAVVRFDQPAPPAPNLITPANNSTNITLTPTFDWSDVSAVTDYQLQVSTSTAFVTNVINLGNLTSSMYSVPPGVLSASTQYFWRVTARTPNGYSPIAGPWSFTTIPVPPAAPILLSPTNGATGTSLTPLLDWQDVSGAATYTVQISTNSSFTSTVLNQTGVTASQFNVPGGTLQNNVLYYWRVSSVNPGGQSAWSAVWNFRPAMTGLSQVTGEIPKVFRLYENYPNPFNPVTKIKFDIASNSEVKLVVYDLLGKVVTTLVSGNLDAGTFETSFEGSNYSSGVYFYRLDAGSYTAIKKMLLTK